MFKYIYNLFFANKEEKIAAQIKTKYKQAIDFQRNGNIKAYSLMMNEIANLENELEGLRNDSRD
jgi:cell fate (sporulation/competence/biofilm development) regulator YmcA (YheA/YmcA/DUF963 family)